MPETPLRIIFAGTPEFAVPSLRALIDDPAFEVILVVSQPDKPVGRSQHIVPTPVKAAAEAAGLDVLQPTDINKEYPDIDHDILVVVAYGQILKQNILDAPNIAPVNLHASLLPRWRGASPMQSAILAGDPKTGVSIQRMVAELDAGPILAQSTVDLNEDTTIESLHDTLADLGATLLTDTLKKPLNETPQNADAVTVCHKLSRDTGNIDPANLTADEVRRYVCALVPWPGVTCKVDGTTVKLIAVSMKETDESVSLQCKDKEIHIVSLQPPGKKVMSGQAWQRGRK